MTNELAMPGGSALPAYLQEEVAKGGPAKGLENATGQGLPMLLLAQGQGAATQDFGRQAGDIYLSAAPTEAVLVGSKQGAKLHFSPFFYFPEVILWAPRSQGGGLLDRTKNMGSELARRAERELAEMMTLSPEEKAQREAAVAYHVFLVFLYGPDGTLNRDLPVALPLSKTKHKVGKQLITLAKLRKGAPLYAGKYALSVVTETSKRGGHRFKNYAVENAGWAAEQDFPFLKAQYEQASKDYETMVLNLGAAEEPEASPAGAGTDEKEF